MNTLESSRREKQTGGKRQPISGRTGRWVTFEFDPDNPPPLTPEQKAEIEALARKPDSEIDYSDIPPLDEEIGKSRIVVGNPWITPPTKGKLRELLIDSDIICWVLHQSGEDYMNKINTMLRRQMEAERALAQND